MNDYKIIVLSEKEYDNFKRCKKYYSGHKYRVTTGFRIVDDEIVLLYAIFFDLEVAYYEYITRGFNEEKPFMCEIEIMMNGTENWGLLECRSLLDWEYAERKNKFLREQL